LKYIIPEKGKGFERNSKQAKKPITLFEKDM